MFRLDQRSETDHIFCNSPRWTRSPHAQACIHTGTIATAKEGDPTWGALIAEADEVKEEVIQAAIKGT